MYQPDGLKMHNLLQLTGDSKVVLVSYGWLKPWGAQDTHEQTLVDVYYELICTGVKRLAAKEQWDLEAVYVWLNLCEKEEDVNLQFQAGMKSLRCISLCDAVLIPSAYIPKEAERTLEVLNKEYTRSLWTMLHCMSFYHVSILAH